jgi:hypothetical protein
MLATLTPSGNRKKKLVATEGLSASMTANSIGVFSF